MLLDIVQEALGHYLLEELAGTLQEQYSHSRDLELSATASLFCIRPRLSPHDDISAIRICVSDLDPDSAALGSNGLTVTLSVTSCRVDISLHLHLTLHHCIEQDDVQCKTDTSSQRVQSP